MSAARTVFDGTPCEGCGARAWRHDNPDDMVPLCRECFVGADPWEPDDDEARGVVPTVTIDTRGRT